MRMTLTLATLVPPPSAPLKSNFLSVMHKTTPVINAPMNSRIFVSVVVFVGMVFSAWGEEEGVRDIRAKAEAGDSNAQFALGVMYDVGEGVPRNDVEAVKWYRLSAEQGNARAQYNLGVMYFLGRGVPKDDAKAVKWLRLSAEQGDSNAQNNLGLMYSLGRGVPKDLVLAYKWLNLASANGDENAIKNRGVVEEEMTPAQIEEGQRI